MTYVYGTYTIIRIGGRRMDEYTNVGVIIFGADGAQIEYKVDTLDRAVARGDWDADWRAIDLDAYCQDYPTVDHVRRALETIAHAMSVIQVREPYGTMIREGGMAALWQTFIEGRA